MQPTADLYPSRYGGEEERIIPREDPVIWGSGNSDSEYALQRAQLGSYERNGYLVMPEAMPDVVAPLLQEMPRLRERMRGREELYTEPDSRELRTVFQPHDFSELIDRVSRDPRIVDRVRQILGSDVYITQARINVKPAYHGRSFSWHSDFETWHVEDGMPRMRALTAWIMLTENTECNGPLYVVPGSHHHYISCAGVTADDNYRQSLKRQEAGVPSKEVVRRVLGDRSIAGIYGKPGTLVFHDCNLLHGSPDNIALDPRTILMFVFNSVDNVLQQPYSGQHPRPYYLANRQWRPVTTAGDRAATA